ncbi:MAG: DNA N-6-adenine-methyltransferase [Oscillospiraceae bacterium]|jgi:site-specific DNA-methyltransferase (adenine-specific)
MLNKVVFSKKSDHWETPRDLYELLDQEFHFDFDPCPIHANFDAFNVNWGGVIFINPPYSNIKNFLSKGLAEMQAGHAKTLVYLIPSRTDTCWFHELILANKAEIRFIKGRLKFQGGKYSAPFPSMVVVFRK